MWGFDELSGKRNAPESEDAGRLAKRRRTVEEVASSYPQQPESFAFGGPPAAESCSAFSSPVAPQQMQLRSPYERQLSLASSGYNSSLASGGVLQPGTTAFWGRQPSLPGCSDMSEQTHDDVQSSQQLAPQSSSSLLMPPPPQRSNSAPDLRLLLGGPVNPLPPVVREPVLQSSSLAGALVPFKAPEGRHLF